MPAFCLCRQGGNFTVMSIDGTTLRRSKVEGKLELPAASSTEWFEVTRGDVLLGVSWS